MLTAVLSGLTSVLVAGMVTRETNAQFRTELLDDARSARTEAVKQETTDLMALLLSEKERTLEEWDVIFEENRARDRSDAEAAIDRIVKQLADARGEIREVVAEENGYAIAEMRALSDGVVEITAGLVGAICTNDYWASSLWWAIFFVVDHFTVGEHTLEKASELLSGLALDGTYTDFSKVCGLSADDQWVILETTEPIVQE